MKVRFMLLRRFTDLIKRGKQKIFKSRKGTQRDKLKPTKIIRKD